MSAEPRAPFDDPAYQQIAAASCSDGTLKIEFGNGDVALIETSRLDEHWPGLRWAELEANQWELLVPYGSEGAEAEIPWLELRGASDPAFGAYLQEVAAEQDRLIGCRLSFYRRQQGVSIAGLAERSGVPAERIAAIEDGEHADFAELRLLLDQLGLSLLDFVIVEG